MKQTTNYYKIATYVLLAIIILLAVWVGFSFYGENKVREGFVLGQENTVGAILSTVSETGSVQIGLPNGENATLVGAQSIEVAQQNVVSQILTEVRETGQVTLLDEQENPVVLVLAEEQANSN